MEANLCRNKLHDVYGYPQRMLDNMDDQECVEEYYYVSGIHQVVEDEKWML
jgi:hypothetical protein